MIDFEVIFADWITYRTIRSKVYAVSDRHFLIADEKGDFQWVLINDCKLPIDRTDDYDGEDDEETTKPYRDTYDLWVEESQKDY